MEEINLYKQRKNKYVDLKVNGRLFPSWILANFKKYKLPEIIKGDGDPCNETFSLELRKYQLFLSQYLDFKSPFHDILIYHGLGSGKTATAINIYNVLYNYTPGWNVFILIKATLRDATWAGELSDWLAKEENEYRYKNIKFIHYDAPNAGTAFLDAMKTADNSKKSLYIFDETHNFIRNVYSNITSTKGKRAQIIYDAIIQDKKENPDTRVILISATPAINNPFELALLFNLLRPGTFPKSESEFNGLYINNVGYRSMNKKKKNLFQRRIMGLVSYYNGATPDYFAEQKLISVNVPMSQHQIDIYNYYEEIEKKIESNSKNSKGSNSVYKSYTRQASNFVFPQIDQRVNGEGRPRPGRFRISDREAEQLLEGKSIDADKDTAKMMALANYKDALNTYSTALVQYFDKYNKRDVENGHTIMNDINTFLTKYNNSKTTKYDGKGNKYNSSFDEFVKREEKKSELFDKMHISSAKMLNIIFNVMASPGPTVVYSNYVLMEGLEIFKVYLSYFNFYSFTQVKQLIPDKEGYVEYHGNVDQVERTKGKNMYNMENNKYGKFIKIMLVSPAGSEGLSLMNVRQIHIMEPYWNEVRISQMIGRGIRQCSHKLLKIEERKVDVFRYKSINEVSNKLCTDQYIEELAKTKDGLIQSFFDAVKEVAVDCELNKNHNKLGQDYKCFKFDESSMFDKQVGPAYKDDLQDDMRMDNGSNSSNSVNLRIKVMKIKAVILKSDPNKSEDKKEGDEEEDLIEQPPEYSPVANYWYYAKSGVVYDYNLHYPIGKVKADFDGTPFKIDKETFVIDYLIPIPLIED
jgi:superfamily II DNA or RNA helicase